MSNQSLRDRAKASAEKLYMAANSTGRSAGEFDDYSIIDIRVRAFLDGADWQRRQMAREGGMAPQKGMEGIALLRALNEWKDAGGSDTDVLLALDDYLTAREQRAPSAAESQ